jgi:hypothetical protein
MSWQDFFLSILASILAAIICGISKYIRSRLKKILATAKALAYAGSSKILSYFSSHQVFFLKGMKHNRSSLRRLFFSPIFLSLVICVSLMIFTPVTVNRNEAQHYALPNYLELGSIHVWESEDGKRISEERSGGDSGKVVYRIDDQGRHTVNVENPDMRGMHIVEEFSIVSMRFH